MATAETRGRPRHTIEKLKSSGSYRPDRHGYEAVEATFPDVPIRPTTFHEQQIPFDFDDLIEQCWPGEYAFTPGEENPLIANVWKSLELVETDLSEEYAQKWIWDESDEYAIANGCRFDLKRAMHFAYTCRNCFLVWEGKHADNPLILRTWQPEVGLRMFGWIRPQEDRVVPWVRRYSKAAAWVPKKSGKSPFAAAVGDYLWRYDGVWRLTSKGYEFKKLRGQHVFSMAKNGQQAGIVHRHAYLMAKHSPVLSAEFETKEVTYNKTTAVLTHVPSDSTYEKLCGDTQRSADASEGKNAGGLICDEAHVVDQAMVDANTDMGASAEQFLWFQISTDGSGDGYGKRDKKYGRDVANGTIKDDAYLFRHYGATGALETLTDEACGDPEVWKKANPAWGFTVNPLQFAQAYDRAKSNPGRFSNFKRRRLNIWQEAESPLISKTAWKDCCDPTMQLDEFEGRGLAAGLDLAQIGDFCAFVMVFLDADEIYNVWPKFWLSDQFERKYKDKTPVQEWTEADVTVHAGEVRLSEVEADISELLNDFDVNVLGYDAMFAGQMAQNLREETMCTVVKYPQTLQQYANGTALFSRAINNEKQRRVRHPGHPVLDWMANHVEVEERNGLQKPKKNADTPWNKIDGIQAMIMAIDCVHFVEDSSPYDEPGGLSL